MATLLPRQKCEAALTVGKVTRGGVAAQAVGEKMKYVTATGPDITLLYGNPYRFTLDLPYKSHMSSNPGLT